MPTTLDALSPAVFTSTSSELTATVSELSKFGTYALEKLSRCTPAEFNQVKDFWKEVHGAYAASTHEKKTSALQDVDQLLTMTETLAHQVMRSCLGTIPTVKKKGLSMRNKQWDKAKGLRARIKKNGQEYANHVMELWTATLQRKSAIVQPQKPKNVGLLMQISRGEIKTLLGKLDVVKEYKMLAAKDSSVIREGSIEPFPHTTRSSKTAHASSRDTPTASSKVRPRTWFANGLGQLGISDEVEPDQSEEEASNTSARLSELSSGALQALEKLLSRTPTPMKALKTLWREVQGQGSKGIITHDDVDESSLFKDLSDFISIPEDIALLLSKKLMRSESSMGRYTKKLSQAQWEHLKSFARMKENVNWPHFYAVDRLMKSVVGMRRANRVKAEHVEELCGLLLLGKKEADEVLKLASVPRTNVERRSQTEMAAAQALVALSSAQAGQDPAGSRSQTTRLHDGLDRR